MSDLISRQAAIEVIDAIFPVEPMKNEYAQGITCGAALAKTYVEQLPSAQPQRKKGKWILSDDRQWKTCSECGAEIDISRGTGVYIGVDAVSEMRFCPSCGVDMRGESE